MTAALVPRRGREQLVRAAAVGLGVSSDGDPSASFVMEADRMRAYQLALELQCHANTLVPSLHRVVRNQFERASLSVVLNSG